MSNIDVRELIARYNHKEHVERADAYFEKASSNPYYWRKPLYTGTEAGALLRNLSQVIGHLELYPGARLLDFGAGTCWSSRMFAYMGCQVTAVDVSVNALKLGEEIISQDPLRSLLDIRFLPYDGVSLPADAASIDRVVCFDCFHHVPDQRATLAEFHRILRPGGIIGFSEPGPNHSFNEQSQFEMRSYGVIENNIRLSQIWKDASAIGFSEISVIYSTFPQKISLNEFDSLISGDVKQDKAKALLDNDAAHHDNTRIFLLYKPGGATIPSDSRSSRGLSYKLTVDLRREGDAFVGRLRVTNSGEAVWLPSGSAVGAVNVGVHLLNERRELVALDYARIRLGDGATPSGSVREVDFRIPAPAHGGELIFDLVAEGVTWFEPCGAVPVVIPINT